MGLLKLIDSPGENEQIPTVEISTQLVNTIEPLLLDPNHGLSGIFQTVMIPKAGRITQTQVMPILKILMTLTILYPTFDQQEFPRINIIFTNFSRFYRKNKKINIIGPKDDNYENEEEFSFTENNETEFYNIISHFK